MPQEKTIPEILMIARICQYLAANYMSDKSIFGGGNLDQNLSWTIHMERTIIQAQYDKNPSDPNLRKAANYLYAMLGPFVAEAEQIMGNLTFPPPIVSGPPDQTINISGTASFTISVASTTPYVITWYRNGVLQVGQIGLTYSYPATLANNGDTVNAVVSNLGGIVSSRIATLTVSNVMQGFFWFGDDNPWPDISSGVDNLTYELTVNITPSQPINVPAPAGAANNKYNVTKYPVSQGLKTIWFNTPFNNGTIPDSVYQTIAQIGGFYYIVSREAMSLDPSQPLIFS